MWDHSNRVAVKRNDKKEWITRSDYKTVVRATKK
jgi:hypothetical protein